MNDFVFGGYTRRVARAVIDAMVPRWPDFERELTDEVLDSIETLARSFPTFNQVGVLAMFYLLEFGSGPLTLDGIRPLSRVARERAIERLERMGDHPIPLLRQPSVLLSTLIGFAAYSRPDVEAFMGVPRRAWRRDRRAFRDLLVQIDAGRADPAPPNPLGGAPLATAETYLLFAHERAARAGAAQAG